MYNSNTPIHEVYCCMHSASVVQSQVLTMLLQQSVFEVPKDMFLGAATLQDKLWYFDAVKSLIRLSAWRDAAPPGMVSYSATVKLHRLREGTPGNAAS